MRITKAVIIHLGDPNLHLAHVVYGSKAIRLMWLFHVCSETWRMPFQTAPVTGSLVSVAANLRVAEFGTLFLVFIGDGDRERPAAGSQVRC